MQNDEPTVDSIRDELRTALFGNCFGLSQAITACDNARIDLIRQVISNFALFGTRTKLITDEEGKDWVDAAFGRQTVGDVADKWDPIKDDEPSTGIWTPESEL